MIALQFIKFNNPKQGQIAFSLIKELARMSHQERVSSLSNFFPQQKHYFIQMNQDQISYFVSMLISNYQHLEDAVTTISHNFPPNKEMLKICQELLPQLKTDIETMDTEQLQKIFGQVMEELKKQPQSKIIKFVYLEKNPYETRIVNKDVMITCNFKEVLEYIKVKDLRFYQALTSKEENQIVLNLDAPDNNQIEVCNNISQPIQQQRPLIVNLEQTIQNNVEVSNAPSNPQQNQIIIENKQEFHIQNNGDGNTHNQITIVVHSEKPQQTQQKEQYSVNNQQSQKQHPILIQSESGSESKNVQAGKEHQKIQGNYKQVECTGSTGPQKRTFDEMISTNQHLEETKHSEESKQGSTSKKSKFNIPDLRQKLMQKLPELQSSIMQLNDEQIEKIFMESIESSKGAGKDKNSDFSRSNGPKDSMKKGVMTRADQAKFNGKAETSQTMNNGHRKDIFKGKTKNGSTEIVEFMSKNDQKQGRPKRNRTIMLIHTEEEIEEDVLSKRRKNDNGETKKCNCDCCRKNSDNIPESFKKFLKTLIGE